MCERPHPAAPRLNARRGYCGETNASWIKVVFIGIVSIASVLTLVELGMLIVQGRRPPDRTAPYVALGSSFAAGYGLGPRLEDSPYACLKSSNGYPQQLAKMLNLSLENVTCYGATTTHVLHGGQNFLGFIRHWLELQPRQRRSGRPYKPSRKKNDVLYVW